MVRVWAGSIFAVTVFAEELAPMKEFYERVFELPCVFEGDTSAVFRFGETLITMQTMARSVPVASHVLHYAAMVISATHPDSQ